MKRFYFFLLTLLLFTNSTCSQELEVKPVPQFLLDKIPQQEIEIPSDAIEIVTYLPEKYSKRGDKDYTDYVQKALSENKKIVFPNFPILISDKGLFIESNTDIYFREKSKLIAQPSLQAKTDYENRKDWYDMIRVYGKENIGIFNAALEGDRFKHVGNEGEWGAGIGIRDSKNIIVVNATISNNWGDGIFVGSEKGLLCEDIILKNIKIDKARRNGLSITSVKNCYVENILISNTYGTLPECAVDIEPSWYKDLVENIFIENIYTFNNKGGININTSALGRDDVDLKRNVTIYIKNHFDQWSRLPFTMSLNPTDKKYIPYGFVYLENMSWNDNKTHNYIFSNNNKKNINVYVDKVNILKEHKNITKEVLTRYKGRLIYLR